VSASRVKKKQRRRARPETDPTAAGKAPGPAAAARAPAPAAAAPASRFDVRDGVARPQPPWAPFPLTEIGMAAGIAIFGIGFATASGWLLSIGVLVLVVVTGELSLREHFAGFRSHTLLLSVLPVVVAHATVVLAITRAYGGPFALVADLAVAGGLGWLLHGRFQEARAGATASSSST
jgi:hypothetical protein